MISKDFFGEGKNIEFKREIPNNHDRILCMVGRNPYPTHCFDLLTDNTNKAAKIQCALFKGTTRDIFIDRKEFNRQYINRLMMHIILS